MVWHAALPGQEAAQAADLMGATALYFGKAIGQLATYWLYTGCAAQVLEAGVRRMKDTDPSNGSDV